MPKSEGRWFICLLAEAGNSKDQFADGTFRGFPMKSTKSIRLGGLNYGQEVVVNMRVHMNDAGDGLCEPHHLRSQTKFKVSREGTTKVDEGDLKYSVSWHVE
jgi:hypothetical protein